MLFRSAIPEQNREAFRSLEQTQRILIQEDSDKPVEIEEVLEEGFLTVVRTPLTRAKSRTPCSAPRKSPASIPTSTA